jgi:oligoribonuclease
MKSSENLVWIDCEMTGLDVEKDCLVEIAVLVTDSELNILDDGLSVVIKPREDSLAGMGEFVTNMHKKPRRRFLNTSRNLPRRQELPR